MNSLLDDHTQWVRRPPKIDRGELFDGDDEREFLFTNKPLCAHPTSAILRLAEENSIVMVVHLSSAALSTDDHTRAQQLYAHLCEPYST
jgi:hypothetical protein